MLPTSFLPGQTLINAAYGLIFLSTFVIVRRFIQEQESILAQQNLSQAQQRAVTNSDRIAQMLRPIYSYYIVPYIANRPFWDTTRIKTQRNLIKSGLKEEFTPDEFIAFKLTLIVFFPLVLVFSNSLDFTSFSWWIVVASGPFGFVYPDLILQSKATKRAVEILRAMPFVVDLLALATESGLDFVGAMARVSERAERSPLIEEFDQVLKEIRIGSSRTEALREMATRINLSEVNSFVAILIASDQLGAPISRVLKQQSEQIRNQRLTKAEKLGAQAAQKLNLPIFVFILPAAFLMIIGPIGLSFFYKGK
jgi:tight adherence protein C